MDLCDGSFHVCGEQDRSELLAFFFADAPDIVLLVNETVMNNDILRLAIFGLLQIFADDLSDFAIDQVIGVFFTQPRDIMVILSASLVWAPAYSFRGSMVTVTSYPPSSVGTASPTVYFDFANASRMTSAKSA